MSQDPRIPLSDDHPTIPPPGPLPGPAWRGSAIRKLVRLVAPGRPRPQLETAIASLQALTVAQPSERRRWLMALGSIAQFIVAIWLVMLVAAAYSLWTKRASTLQEARIDVVNLADTMAQQMADRFDRIDLLLIGLLDRVETAGLDPGAVARLNAVLATQVGAIAGLRQLGIVDADGQVLASSDPAHTDWLPPGGGENHAYHRLHADRARLLARPSRSPTDGSWIINLSRRWNRPDGRFGGEVFASYDLGTIETGFRSMRIGRFGNISLWRADAIMLARLPPVPEAIGTFSPAAAPDIGSRAALGSGTFEVRSSLDHIMRVYSFRRLTGYDLVQFVGIARQDLLANWWLEVDLTLAAVAGLMLLTGFVAVWAIRQARQRLADQAAYRLLAEFGTDLIFYLDNRYIRRYVSAAALDILGYRPEQMVGRSPMPNVHPDDVRDLTMAFELVLGGVERHRITYRTRHSSGQWVWVDVQLRRIALPSADPVPASASARKAIGMIGARGDRRAIGPIGARGDRKASGVIGARGDRTAIGVVGAPCGRKAIGMIGALRDVSDRKASEVALEAANRNLAALANSDALTLLANRRHFDDRLEQEWRRARRDLSPLSLVLIDVDRFKLYNDRYGHLAGDACLRLIAQAIATSLQRPADLAARYGGEELAVLLPDTLADGAYAVAEQITAMVRAAAIAHADGVGGFVTISIGVATRIPAGDGDGETLIAAADQAMYAAKAAGRARIMVARAAAADMPAPV